MSYIAWGATWVAGWLLRLAGVAWAHRAYCRRRSVDLRDAVRATHLVVVIWPGEMANVDPLDLMRAMSEVRAELGLPVARVFLHE